MAIPIHAQLVEPAGDVPKDRLLPLPQVARELGISRQRIYQLVAQRQLPVVRVHGVQHLTQQDVQRLRQERDATPPRPGRKRTPLDVPGLPRVPLETLRQALQAVETRLLSPDGVNFFATAGSPCLPLAIANWRLARGVQTFLADTVAGLRGESLPCPEISLTEARRIHALLQQAVGATPVASPTPPAGTARYVLADDDLFKFLTYGAGLRLSQSLVIHGRWGTGKSRLSAMLAVRIAAEVRRPVLYITPDHGTQYAASLLEQTARAWQVEQAQVVLGSDGGQTPGQLLLHVLRAPADFPVLAEEMLRLAAVHQPAVIVLDSLGGLQEIDRLGLDRLLKSLQTQEVLVILVAEEEDGGLNAPALSHALWVSDLVIRTRAALPGGRDALEKGLSTRAFELLKSRRQRVAEGRHYCSSDERLEIYPALACWGTPELFTAPTLAAHPYQPGFSLPHSAPHLAALDHALALQWAPGGALALHAGPRTFKDLLCLYACARAVRDGRSCILLNLRPDYLTLLRAWMEEMPRYDCFQTLRDIPCLPFDPATFGLQPALHVLQVDPGTAIPERLLWQVAQAMLQSARRPHAGALVAWLHCSELLALPGFRTAPDFPMYALRMLSGLGVASLLSLDTDGYQRYLALTNAPDVLPLIDVTLELRRLDQPAFPQPTVEVRSRAGILRLTLHGDDQQRYLAAASLLDHAVRHAFDV